MTDDRPTVLTPTRARQGVTGHNVRYVLIFSTALVAIAFLAVALFMRASGCPRIRLPRRRLETSLAGPIDFSR